LKGTNPKNKNDIITFNQKLANEPPSNTLQCACGAQCNMGNMFGTSYNIHNKLSEDGSTWAYVKMRYAS
jgi:hypothetical protein